MWFLAKILIVLALWAAPAIGVGKYIHDAELAKSDLRAATAENNVKEARAAAMANLGAYERCRALNQKNADDGARQASLEKQKAKQAELDAAVADKKVADIYERSHDYQSDTTLRLLTDPLPESLVARVRRPAN